MAVFHVGGGTASAHAFNQRIFIEGVPSESTVSDLFVQQALDDAAIYGYASTDEALGGGDIFPYSASLAWRTLLLLPDNDDIYATAVGVRWKSSASSSGPAACGKPKSGLAPATATG